jgi:hypothetical protein
VRVLMNDYWCCARSYRGDFVVVTVGPNELRAMDFFDVEEADVPTLRLLDLRTEPMYKYRCVHRKESCRQGGAAGAHVFVLTFARLSARAVRALRTRTVAPGLVGCVAVLVVVVIFRSAAAAGGGGLQVRGRH